MRLDNEFKTLFPLTFPLYPNTTVELRARCKISVVENLYKVGGSNRRIHEGKKLLWQGKVDETLALFSPLKKKQAQKFCQYLENHRD